MEDIDDDFGDLYADIEVQPSSAINAVSDFSQLYQKQQQSQQQQHCNEVGVNERRENDSETNNNGDNEVGLESGSDSDDDDDDFDVVVNDEDIAAKNGGGDRRRCCEEVVEDMKAELVAGVAEGNLPGKNQMWVDVEQSGGGGCGGERGNVGKSGCNSQHKYLRRYGSIFAGNQHPISSWKANREDSWHGQSKMSGFVSGLAGGGNNFWLPWFRTIVDVDIDSFEQKAWTHPGADITDYFNFGFDEESWRSFCQSLDQLRQQTLSQTRRVDETLKFKLENEAGATKELESEGFVDAESFPSGLRKITYHEADFTRRQSKKEQIGQAIHVEDSNRERQPSMDARRPRSCNSDVVIQITLQDPEEPSSSGNEEPDNTHKPEAEELGGSKAYEMGKIFAEEIIRSSSLSSACKRSYESAEESNYMLQDSSGQGKDQNSELDIQLSEKADTFSEGNLRTTKTLNCSMEDVDDVSDTTETNPCVAGIDLLFDDHGCSSSSQSYSNTWSEASEDDDHCDSRRIRDLRRSPSVSKKDTHQVAKVDRHRLRTKRDDKKAKDIGGEYRVRVRNSSEEDLKHNDQRVRRHLKLKSDIGDDDNRQIGFSKHKYGVGCTRTHHQRSEEWCLTSASDDEYRPSYRENGPSFDRYDRRSSENRFQAEHMIDIDRQEHWGSRDENDLNCQREWDEEQCFSIVQKDWHLHKRGCIIKDERPFFQSQRHRMLRFSSSHDINGFKQRRKYDDVHFDKRSKRGQQFHYRYSDGAVHNRYSSYNPLDDRQKQNLDLDIRHGRRLWHSGEVRSSGREDENFEGPFNADYPQYTVNDVDEFWKRQTSKSTHNYRDRLPTYGERRLKNTLYRDDMDNHRLYQSQRYERHCSSISSKKGTGSRQVYYRRDAYNKHVAAKYLDEDDYFEERRNVYQFKGLSWAEDTQFDGCFDNDFCGEDMLDSFKGGSRDNWEGVKNRFVPGGMTMHTQIMKDKFGMVSDGGGKSYSMMSTRSKHEENGLWDRNLVELRSTRRGRKTLQSTGKFSKDGTLSNGACKHADGRFQEQFKSQQERGEAFLLKRMENKALNTEALWDKQPVVNHDNATDLEECQLPTVEPKAEFLKVKRFGSGHLAPKNTLKGTTSHSQILISQNGGCVYDENRILETMAKMEKRRERFKESILMKKDTVSDSKPKDDNLVTAESKGRPARKRKWGGS